ncbi:MAG TPA: hypothetical protein PKY87_08855 [Terricaulis sp.]|nr:hypothetical protein [Terricaulis sp.]
MVNNSSPLDDAPTAPLSRFLSNVSTLCEKLGRRETALSRQLFGHTQRIAQVRAGSDLGVRRLAQAERDLARIADVAGVTLPAPFGEDKSFPAQGVGTGPATASGEDGPNA